MGHYKPNLQPEQVQWRPRQLSTVQREEKLQQVGLGDAPQVYVLFTRSSRRYLRVRYFGTAYYSRSLLGGTQWPKWHAVQQLRRLRLLRISVDCLIFVERLQW